MDTKHIDTVKGQSGYWHITDLYWMGSKLHTVCGRSVMSVNRRCSVHSSVKDLLKLIDCPQCQAKYKRQQERLTIGA